MLQKIPMAIGMKASPCWPVLKPYPSPYTTVKASKKMYWTAKMKQSHAATKIRIGSVVAVRTGRARYFVNSSFGEMWSFSIGADQFSSPVSLRSWRALWTLSLGTYVSDKTKARKGKQTPALDDTVSNTFLVMTAWFLLYSRYTF